MSATPWRPRSESDAVATASAFSEWLRATGTQPDARPDLLAPWAKAAPADFAAAIARFAGLDPCRGLRANLLHQRGPREALVVHDGGTRTVWSRDALAAAPPPSLAAMFARLTWPELVWAVASHLLAADTRPDDRIVWAGDATAPWPLGAWPVGATLILPGHADPARIAHAESARLIRAAPAWPG